jgi:hypothetical protein
MTITNIRDHKYWVDKLSLIPHREGGHFREIYRAEGMIAVKSNDEHVVMRNHSTAIYFLLSSREINALHRIKSDEVWHFYDGSPLAVYEIDAGGDLKKHMLGLDADKGEMPVIIIRSGNWFCAEVVGEDSYTLAGCTVSPGFDFADFELAVKEKLISEYPQHEQFIRKFAPEHKS